MGSLADTWEDVGADERLIFDELSELGLDPLAVNAIAEEFGWSLKKLWRKTRNSLKKTVKILKPIATVASFVYPPAGAAVRVGLEAADRLLSAAGKGGKVAKNARAIYRATKREAKRGNRDARRGLAMLSVAAKYRKQKKVGSGQQSKLSAGRKLSAAARKTMLRRVPVKPSIHRAVVVQQRASKGRAVKQPPAEKGFFVTTKGRIRTGRFRKAA